MSDYAKDPSYLTLQETVERKGKVVEVLHARGMMPEVRTAVVAYLLKNKPWVKNPVQGGLNYYEVRGEISLFELHAISDENFAEAFADAILVDGPITLQRSFCIRRTSDPADIRTSMGVRFVLPS